MWQQLFIFSIFLLTFAFSQNADEKKLHPDVGLKVPELVRKYKYPIESYTVTTKDDYILTVHRIPHGINNANETNKPAVFLMHGTLCSSADWVLMGPEKGLAFLLADRGYDVWMGNARGNTYSRKHKTWEPDYDKKYWDFSWHEIGVYDLPVMIDLVIETTKQEKIFYIGHSQGTATFFAMASSLPEYNHKIRLMTAFGPAAYVGDIPNIIIKFMAKFVNSIHLIAKLFGQYEFLPSNELINDLNKLVCDEENRLHPLCSNILFLIAGFNKEQLNETMVPVILSNTPAGSATKQLVHFGQEVNSKKFRQYDYGLLNWFHYKKFTPPKYDIQSITAPVALYYGVNDLLINPKNVERLHKELPHSVFNYRVKNDKFSHLDFLWAKDVVPLLYDKVFDVLKRY